MDFPLQWEDSQRQITPAEDSGDDSVLLCEPESESVCEFFETSNKSTLSVSNPEKHEDTNTCDSCLSSLEFSLPSPLLSQESIPSQTVFTELCVKEEPTSSISVMQRLSESESPEGVDESWMKPSTTEPFPSFRSELKPYSPLCCSLSPQTESVDGDTVVTPLSDLYILEGDSQDFILSQSLDSNYMQLSPTGGQVSPACGPHVYMSDSAGTGMQDHRGSSEKQIVEDGASEVRQHQVLRAPAADALVDFMSVNDVTTEKVKVDGSTLRRQCSDSSVELWLDACQYLTDEGKEDLDVWDNGVLSDLNDSSFISFGPEDAHVSDFSADGWLGEDARSRRSQVERWSSVDSWASALSDWVGIIEVPPEDITAAFTEIGAEIDALTLALGEVNTLLETENPQEARALQTMDVQDQLLMTQNIPDSSVHTRHSCLSLCLDAPGSELYDKENTKSFDYSCDPVLMTKDEDYWAEQHHTSQLFSIPSSHVMVDETDVAISSGEFDLSQFHGFLKSFDSQFFTSNKKESLLLSITEDTDLRLHAETSSEKPFLDGLYLETSQLGSVDGQQVCFKDNKSTKDLRFLTARALTTADVLGVDTERGLYAHPPSNFLPDLDGASREAPQFGVPEFIMPSAPLSPGSSLIYWRNSNLEGDPCCPRRSLNDSLSCDPVQLYTLCPTPDGITEEPCLKGDDELNQKKQNTISAVWTSTQERHADVFSESFLTRRKSETLEIADVSRELARLNFFPTDHRVVSEENRVACVYLDWNDPFVFCAEKSSFTDSDPEKAEQKMPHRTHKNPSESRTRSKKEKPSAHHHDDEATKKQETVSHLVSMQNIYKQTENHPVPGEHLDTEKNLLIETAVGNEKGTSKPHKKKKKHGQNVTAKSGGEQSVDVENGAKSKTAKGRIEMFEDKLCPPVVGEKISQQTVTRVTQAEKSLHHTDFKDHKTKSFTGSRNDDAIKKRRVSGEKFGKIVSSLESKLPKAEALVKAKGEENKVDRKKAYSDVVKQNIGLKEDPKVVQPIQAESVSGDPQSLCLWCQFSALFLDYTVTWNRDGTLLAEIKRSAGDESRVLLTISNASHKDLGRYQCRLSVHGSPVQVTLDYVLTYEVLSEIVIPLSPKTVSSTPADVCCEEEDVHCSNLLFKEDFLSDQYFGEKHPISILTEKAHFGEGMHRRAFRTKLQAGQIPLLVPGYSCVLKVHNAISYGTKNNDELIEKNFSLAVEECQVQNTAREYIKAYTAAAQSVEAFGDIPEIIPIYLVHRPSNDIPYATLEEELIGDFVKYSVKDGKEINLMRRDSEAGQKCCAFQHWVYQNTEGNLLVTDMQGVGMRLTDVGIATCKKGYKGFKGNCSTTFIDQFKALHQCNKYCEILGLKSVQPKTKKSSGAPKPKPQPSAGSKKKPIGSTVKSKS